MWMWEADFFPPNRGVPYSPLDTGVPRYVRLMDREYRLHIDFPSFVILRVRAPFLGVIVSRFQMARSVVVGLS
jgi:hypothetical protein